MADSNRLGIVGLLLAALLGLGAVPLPDAEPTASPASIGAWTPAGHGHALASPGPGAAVPGLEATGSGPAPAAPAAQVRTASRHSAPAGFQQRLLAHLAFVTSRRAALAGQLAHPATAPPYASVSW